MSRSTYFNSPGVSSAWKQSRANLNADHHHVPADPTYQHMFQDTLRQLKLNKEALTNFSNDCKVVYHHANYIVNSLSNPSVLCSTSTLRL